MMNTIVIKDDTRYERKRKEQKESIRMREA